VRTVIEYAYDQRGSIKHWDRSKVELREALSGKNPTPLGTRVDVHRRRTIWIEMHVVVEPREDSGEVINRDRLKTTDEIQKRPSSHIILARRTLMRPGVTRGTNRVSPRR
jgi:hypothetical protein